MVLPLVILTNSHRQPIANDDQPLLPPLLGLSTNTEPLRAAQSRTVGRSSGVGARVGVGVWEGIDVGHSWGKARMGRCDGGSGVGRVGGVVGVESTCGWVRRGVGVGVDSRGHGGVGWMVGFRCE